MSSYTLRFFKYLLGLRGAATTYTDAELKFLASLAIGKKCIVEVGVEEGVDSKLFCQNMSSSGKLYLVEPYFCRVKLENFFNISFAEFVAKQCVKDYDCLVHFVKMTSLEASKYLNLEGKADFIFIDLKHDYESVLENFRCWSPMLSSEGIMAIPYSRICKERPGLNPQSGAIRLCNEIARGEYGNWKIVDKFEWITLISADSSCKNTVN